MAAFVGGIGSPFPQPTEVAPISFGGAGKPTPLPFVGWTGAPAHAPLSLPESKEGLGFPAPSDSAAPAKSVWFAPTPHVDASGIQWFAGLASNDGLHSEAAGVDSIGIGAMKVGSVFAPDSGHGWDGGMGDGSYAIGALPFTHETSFDDTPIYTASADTPWMFAADFTGDGWFFV
jgi:hypothetical protein